jgi:hypothetical protein
VTAEDELHRRFVRMCFQHGGSSSSRDRSFGTVTQPVDDGNEGAVGDHGDNVRVARLFLAGESMFTNGAR